MNLEPTIAELELNKRERVAAAIARIASRHHDVAIVEIRHSDGIAWTPDGMKRERWFTAYIVRRVLNDGDLDCYASSQRDSVHEAAVDCLTRMYGKMSKKMTMQKIIDALDSELADDGVDRDHVAKIHRQQRDDKMSDDDYGDELELNERGDRCQTA